jgi:F-type H+-transporting ATPase subunit b
MSALFAAFGVNWHLLLVQLFNFALLLAALTYFLYRPILNIIDERREKIAEGVRTAALAQQRLEDAQKEGEGIVGDAAREAETLVTSARTRASETGAEIVKTAESKAATMLRDAAALAEESKRRAMQESEKEIAKAAMLAAEKILRAKA